MMVGSPHDTEGIKEILKFAVKYQVHDCFDAKYSRNKRD